MKKYIRLFIIAMAVLFIMPNVHAREFTIDGVNYSIEGVKVNLYKMEYDNGSIKTENLEKYVKKQPTKVIDIDITNMNYHPKYKTIEFDIENVIGGEYAVQKGHFIDLDFNINKTVLNKYLATDMATTTEDTAYMFEVVLQLKFTSLPSTVNKVILLNNEVREDSAYELELDNYTDLEELDTSKVNDYVFAGGYLVDNNMEFYNKVFSEDEEETKELDGFAVILSSYEYRAISFMDSLTFKNADEKNELGIAFLDIDDFNELIDYESEYIGNITGSGDVKEITYDTIPVPNTAMDFSKIIYIVGYILIIGGVYVLLRFKTKKGSN